MTTRRQHKKNAKKAAEQREIEFYTNQYVSLVINNALDEIFEKIYGINPTDMLIDLVDLYDERRRMEEVGE